MQPFEYIETASVQEAVSDLASGSVAARIIAGGTDLLGEMKDGIVFPQRLVSLARIPSLKGIEETSSGLTIGAMTTIAEIAAHPTVRTTFTALAEAAGGLATPQIRNVGTLGGNLAQRPRCWYYRHPLTRCLKKGGSHCFALEGHNKYLCVTGGERCYIVHPSDTAVALTALDATIEIVGPTGTRSISIEHFFTGPGQDITKENVLRSNELVTRVQLPVPPPGRRSTYLKASEREAGDFALASVACVLDMNESVIARASVVLGGVAPVPYRAREVEVYLRGKWSSEIDPAHAGSLALPNATPMTDNGYKVILARNLVKRAVGMLLHT